MHVTTYQKDSSVPTRAEIHENNGTYTVQFYGPDGSHLKTETFTDKSVYYVQDVAENYINGIKVLNG